MEGSLLAINHKQQGDQISFY